MQIIIVTGANGQLGQELQSLAKEYANYKFVWTDKDEMDITNIDSVKNVFEENRPTLCINCAAYTAVDKAEDDGKELCKKINVDGVKNLAKTCKEYNAKMIHISTDFVFDGKKNTPYAEDDTTNPISVYGETKRESEQVCLQENKESIIIRTSWLYSEFGANFVKTMLKLTKEKQRLNIIADQIGTPTYARDLAKAILDIVAKDWSGKKGIYHYSNEGTASWYDFTQTIKEYSQNDCDIKPIPTEQYPTPAERPKYSVMDKTKIKETFDISIPYWRDSVKKCIEKLNK